MNELKNISQLDFDKMDGLIPVVAQDNETLKVLMVGFMNREAIEKTQEIGKVTFFSRTKKRLWAKGEESGNFLNVVSVLVDCDEDTLLIKVNPVGPVCHTGTDTCFDEVNPKGDVQFLSYLQDFIDKRKNEMPAGSYTTSLFKKGTRTIAQKVGEEAAEVIIAAKNWSVEEIKYESADLLYHLFVLLSDRGMAPADVMQELKDRR